MVNPTIHARPMRRPWPLDLLRAGSDARLTQREWSVVGNKTEGDQKKNKYE